MTTNKFFVILETLLILCTVKIYAGEYKIGNQKIAITQPQGWVDISSVAPEWVSLSQKLMPADLKVLTGLWERSDVELFTLDKRPLLQRYFLISTYAKIENTSLGKSDFEQLKDTIKKQFDSQQSQVKEKIRAVEKQVSDVLSDSENTIKFKNKSFVPLGVDYEDENILSVSLINTSSISVNGKEQIVVQGCVMSFILVKGKVILLYGYTPFREQKDLKWCQDQSLIVARRIFEGNALKTPFPMGIIPQGNEFSVQSQELLQESLKTYSSTGNPKAKGIELSIDIPISWKSQSSKRPNIVFNFVAPDYKMILPSCIVMIKDIPGLTPEIISTISEEDAKDSSFFKTFFGEEFQYIRGGLTKIEGEKTIWAEGYQHTERANFKLSAYFLNYIIFYKEKGIVITFICGSSAKDAPIKEVYDAYLPLFQKIAASVVIQSKWK